MAFAPAYRAREDRAERCRTERNEKEGPKPRWGRPDQELFERAAIERALCRVDLVRNAVERRTHHRDPPLLGEALGRVIEHRLGDPRDLCQARLLRRGVAMHRGPAEN